MNTLELGIHVENRQREEGVYNSLLTKDLNYQLAPPAMHYQGAMFWVFYELENELNSTEASNRLLRLFHPPRILRGLIDHRIASYPGYSSKTISRLIQIQHAVALAEAVYKSEPDAIERLEELGEIVAKDDTRPLFWEVSQSRDFKTWEAMNPLKSQESARLLNEHMGDRDLLFIALAHGGVAGGLDTFLRYRAINGNNTATFYPLRFSRGKKQDTSLNITNAEWEYLSDIAQEREVVIFDEDVWSGTTINKAHEELSYILDKPVTTLVNHGWSPNYAPELNPHLEERYLEW